MIAPGPRPHVGGSVTLTQQAFVTVEGVPIATVGDSCLCCGVPTTAKITGGSSVVNINGKPAARLTDPTSHGGRLVQGVPWITMD
jgi:uncharacterized Zn-binding protein involved in type VI secretion